MWRVASEAMSMGSPGHGPLTDLLDWGLPSKFPEDITVMLLRLKSEAPEELANLPWNAAHWTLAEYAGVGRAFLYAALERHGIDATPYRNLMDAAAVAEKHKQSNSVFIVAAWYCLLAPLLGPVIAFLVLVSTNGRLDIPLFIALGSAASSFVLGIISLFG